MIHLPPPAARLARIAVDVAAVIVGVAAAFAIGGWSVPAVVVLAVAVLTTTIAFIIIMREISR